MTNSSPNIWINATIGAFVTLIFSFTVVSPILGGALAGYLQREGGPRVGALAGAIASLPLLLFAFGMAGFLGLIAAPIFISIFMLLVMVIFLPLYIIGLSALGGYLGVYLRAEL